MVQMNYFLSKKCRFLTLVALAAAGCGGGTAGSGSGAGAVQSTDVGDATVSFIGAAKPAVLDTETGLTVNTVAGASFTNFTVQPAAIDSNTSIAWLVPNGGEVVTYQRGVTAPALNHPGNFAYRCAYGHDGLLYYGVAKLPFALGVNKSYLDGSGVSNVYTEGTSYVYDVAVSPTDLTIVGGYADGSEGIFSVSSTGTNYKLLDATGSQPSISPDGTTVVFV
jgi:hypothetical protein